MVKHSALNRKNTDRYRGPLPNNGTIAQQVEHRTFNATVESSNLSGPTIYKHTILATSDQQDLIDMKIVCFYIVIYTVWNIFSISVYNT